MEVLEMFADSAGETHFRRTAVEFEMHDFAPPSQPVGVSGETVVTTSLFLKPPLVGTRNFTPRRSASLP